ncbi:MAG: DUF4329 domain-containing protein [Gammaproteobacteria bacterium]|nr:DUF4329 domain-containing protein [Gammaproteobacteria bacterium]
MPRVRPETERQFNNSGRFKPGLYPVYTVYVAFSGSSGTTSYHTHAGPDPRYDSENFSEQDLLSDREFALDGYLGTPGGQFKYHNYITGAITTLGTIAN